MVSETAFKNVWGLLVFLVCFFFFLTVSLLFWGFFKHYFLLEAELDKDTFLDKTAPEELHGELIWGSELITLGWKPGICFILA